MHAMEVLCYAASRVNEHLLIGYVIATAVTKSQFQPSRKCG